MRGKYRAEHRYPWGIIGWIAIFIGFLLASMAYTILVVSMATNLGGFNRPPAPITRTESETVSAPSGWLAASQGTWLVKTARGRASAFPIDSQPMGSMGHWVLFLTADHVVDDLSFVESFQVILTHHDGSHAHARVVSRFHEGDAALLGCLLPASPNLLDLAWRHPTFGERLYHSGYVAGAKLYVTEGLASSPGHASVSAFPGCSGGPIMDATGRVVGLLTAVYNDMHSYATFAVIYQGVIPLGEWLARETSGRVIRPGVEG